MIDSELYRSWYEQVVLPPENDFLICVSASSHTPVSGTGKTTLGVGLGKSLDRSESGFDAETQATLSAEEFANTVIPEAETKSAVVMDETQGTPGGGSGLNRMRAMSQSTMDAIGSVLANRDKSLTMVVIVQQIHMLFSDLYPLIDAWLLINKAPGQINGPKLKHYKIHTGDMPDDSDGIRTPFIEYLSWPAIPESDPDYQVMESKKQSAKTKGEGGPGGGREIQTKQDVLQLRPSEVAMEADEFDDLKTAFQVREQYGTAWRKLPEKVEEELGRELEYSGEYYRQQITDLEDENGDDDSGAAESDGSERVEA